MGDYAPLRISAGQLRVLANSVDYNDRIMAATEVQTLAESQRVLHCETDFVVTCAYETSENTGPGHSVRCFSMASREIGTFVVPSEPYGAWLGAQIKAKMGSSLLGRLVVVSEAGQLLWEDEALNLRAVLQILAEDTDQRVLIALVAALMAVIAAECAELSGFAVEVLYRVVLRGVVQDMEVIAQAFEAIKKAAEHGIKPAVGVFERSLGHSDCTMRLLAVVGLEAPATAGDATALAAILQSADDVEPQVRQAALDSLGSALIALEEGNVATWEALTAQVDTLLDMLENDLNVEVVAALGAAAGSGHTIALEKLLDLAHTASGEAACGAVRGLGIAALQGGAKLCEALMYLVEHSEDDEVSLQAVGSMGTLVKQGRIDIVTSLVNIAENESDRNVFVRLEAIKGLGLGVQAGNELATVAVLNFMRASNTVIRRAAVELVTAIVSEAKVLEIFSLECRGLIDAIMMCRKDEDAIIRRAVISCLDSLRNNGYTAASVPLHEAVKDGDEHVRRVAVRSLGHLAITGNTAAADTVFACTSDASTLVRAEVAAITADLAKHTNTRAMELLLVLEQDDDVVVRTAAQPGTTVTTEIGDAVSIVNYSYEAARLIHHGLGAAAVPMLRAAVVPGIAAPQMVPDHRSDRALTNAMQEKLELAGRGGLYVAGGSA